MLGECRILLNNFVVQTDVFNRWQWLPNIVGGYTVRGAYQLLTHQVARLIAVTRELVWHKQVPLKHLLLIIYISTFHCTKNKVLIYIILIHNFIV